MADDKIYDGTTKATLSSGEVSLVGVVESIELDTKTAALVGVLESDDEGVELDFDRLMLEMSATDFSEVADYAKEAVSALVSNGIINGKNGKIDPKANTTRAEVAVMLSRVLDYVK